MSDQTQHIPEQSPEEQLKLAVGAAVSADTDSPVDAAFAGADAAIDQFDMSPLQRAYTALQLMATHAPSRHVLDHWTEDAAVHPHSLIEGLYSDVLRELVRESISDDASEVAESEDAGDVNPLEYEESQIPSLEPYPDPEETFSAPREQLPSDPSYEEVHDVLDEFSEMYREWDDIVVVQHVLYLTDEVGIDLLRSGCEDQLGHEEPVGAPLVSYVWSSALWHLAEMHLSNENTLVA